MNIEIKKSKNPVKYEDALKYMEERLKDINDNNSRDLIWILNHEDLYTAGTSYKENEILDKSINLIKTNRGGKITYHGPGQLICYFVIIYTLKYYKINTFADKKNIGIWYDDNSKIKKVAAIGVRISKWVAYHGFSINISNDLDKYKAIIPCGILDKGVTNLINIIKQNYKGLENKLLNYFISNLKN